MCLSIPALAFLRAFAHDLYRYRPRQCSRCDRSFLVRGDGATYCSRECQQADRWERLTLVVSRSWWASSSPVARPATTVPDPPTAAGGFLFDRCDYP